MSSQPPARSSNVDVCIRVRPLRTEINESGTAWEIDRNQISQRTNPDCRFHFDSIFPPSVTTPHIYQHMVERTILKNILSGFNATAFVYGQTGSGKSYTMLGPNGLIPTVVRDVFSRCEGTLRRNKKTEKISFSVCMVEIYNEGLRDLLLADGEVRRPLSIRESSLRGAYVHNATMRKVVTAEQLLNAIKDEAEVRRISGATSMNEKSSRSHLIMRLEIEKTEYFESEETSSATEETDDDEEEEEDDSEQNIKRRTYATLNLVDLAGSERVATTGAVGIRLVEGGLINKSLTILTTVIHKLSEAVDPRSRGEQHIPYRDSKLTHMLKSALGGNSFTTIIACISIADQQVDESRSTLHFAARAKTIRNNISLNQVSNNQGNVKLIKELNMKCDGLRRRLIATEFYCWSLKLKQQAGGYSHGQQVKDASHEQEHAEQVAQLQIVIQQLSYANEEFKRAALAASVMEETDASRDPLKVEDLHRQISELQGLYSQALSDQKSQQDMLQEMEELCEDLERDNSEKEQAIKRLSTAQKVTTAPAQVSSTATGAELIDLQDLLTEERKNSAKYLSYTKRLLAVAKLVHGSRAEKSDSSATSTTMEGSDFVGDIQVDTAIRTLSSFIQSRAAMPPAANTRHEDASPKRLSKELGGKGTTPGQADDSASRIQELEAKLLASEAQKDIVTDVKLKRMQDLVMRVHTTNLALQQEMHQVVRENIAMKEHIQGDSKVLKAMKKKLPEGFFQSSHSMEHIMARVLATPMIVKPHGHN